MIVQDRKQALTAGLVTIAGAGATLLLFLSTGMLFFLPLVPIVAIVRNPGVAYLLIFVAIPLAGVVWWRWPWWGRWAWLGILLANLGLLGYLESAFTTGLFGS